jgi:hypothetical protein
MSRELSQSIADCLERSLEAERCAYQATDFELKSGYRRLALQWRDLAETCQFIDKLEHFLHANSRSALQRPHPPEHWGSATPIGCSLIEDAYIPKARPRALEDGSGWYVELTWPDGRIEQVVTFGLESTARDWIDHELLAFVRSKLAH